MLLRFVFGRKYGFDEAILNGDLENDHVNFSRSQTFILSHGGGQYDNLMLEACEE